MARALSLDLRERLVAAKESGKYTNEELAELFGIGTATVKRWWRSYQETGSVAPLPRGGGRRRAVTDEQLPVLEALVKKHPDWSEDEYTAYLHEHEGFTASRSAIGRAIRRLGYVVKKRPSSRRREISRMSESGGESSSGKSPSLPLRVWFSWTKRAPTSQ